MMISIHNTTAKLLHLNFRVDEQNTRILRCPPMESRHELSDAEAKALANDCEKHGPAVWLGMGFLAFGDDAPDVLKKAQAKAIADHKAKASGKPVKATEAAKAEAPIASDGGAAALPKAKSGGFK